MPATLDRPRTEQAPYQPFGAAQTLFYTRDREVVLDGPAGTGKSRACLEKVHLCALKYAGMRALVARRTRRSLTESGLVTFEEKVLSAADGYLKAGAQRTQRHSYHYANGSQVVVGGLDDTTKIMSSEYDLIYVQEAREVSEGDWEDLTSRLRNGVMPYQQIIGDTNPDTPQHWIKQRANHGSLKLLPSRHEDNPSVTPEYLETLDALTGVRHKRLRLGLWVASDGVVYDGWDPATHLVDRFDIPLEWQRFLAVDFGFNNPFVCQWWAMDEDGRLYLHREIYQTQTLVEDHAHQIRELAIGDPHPRALICDHDAEDRATLERHLACSCPGVKAPALRLMTIPAQKDVARGIQAVQARLRVQADREPRLYVLRDSLARLDETLAEKKVPSSTAEEFESYIWDTAPRRLNPDGETLAEVPLKLHDHGCLIAGTLVETARGSVPIEAIRAGMAVRTRSGLRQVIAAGLSAVAAPVVTVHLSNGSTVTGTGNHPIWVQGKGWTALDAVRYNDTCESITATEARSRLRPTTVGARCGSVATTRRARAIPATAGAASRFANAGGIASWPSWPTWASGQWGRRSTVSTAPRDTSLGIVDGPRRPSSSPIEALMSRRILKPSARWLLLGTRARPDGNGTLSTLSKLVLPSTLSEPKPVSSVERHSPRGSRRTHGSAQTAVRPNGVTKAAWMMSSGCAPLAGRYSPSTATCQPGAAPARVLRVSDHGRADVYNLTVAGAPEYFANGVLVHNCDAARYMVVHVDGLPVEVPKPSTYRLGATYQPKDSRPALLRRAA